MIDTGRECFKTYATNWETLILSMSTIIVKLIERKKLILYHSTFTDDNNDQVPFHKYVYILNTNLDVLYVVKHFETEIILKIKMSYYLSDILPLRCPGLVCSFVIFQDLNNISMTSVVW